MGFLELLFEYHWTRIQSLRGVFSGREIASRLVASDPTVVAVLQNDPGVTLAEALLSSIAYSARPVTSAAEDARVGRKSVVIRALFPELHQLQAVDATSRLRLPQLIEQYRESCHEIFSKLSNEQLLTKLQEPLFYLSNGVGILREAAKSMFGELGFSIAEGDETISFAELRATLRAPERIVAGIPLHEILTQELKEAGVVIPTSRSGRRTSIVQAEAELNVVPARPGAKQSSRSGSAKRSVLPTASADPKTRARRASAVKRAPGEKSAQAAPVQAAGIQLVAAAEEAVLTEIFKNDAGDFRLSLALLDGAHNWERASAYLRSLFSRREVDPQSAAGVALTEAVYQRFHPPQAK